MSVRRVVALVQAADERQLVLRYRPPEGYDATRFQRSIERNGATVRRDGSVLVVSVPGVSEAAADRMAALVTHGGLELREALVDASLATVPSDRRGGEADVAPGVRLEIDAMAPRGWWWPTPRAVLGGGPSRAARACPRSDTTQVLEIDYPADAARRNADEATICLTPRSPSSSFVAGRGAERSSAVQSSTLEAQQGQGAVV